MQTGVAAHHSSLGEKDNRALASIFAAYTVSATLWLLFATAVGLLLAYKFGAPDFGAGAWLTFGRLRPIHTNATFLAGPVSRWSGWRTTWPRAARAFRRTA